jgi:hypothetical protein
LRTCTHVATSNGLVRNAAAVAVCLRKMDAHVDIAPAFTAKLAFESRRRNAVSSTVNNTRVALWCYMCVQ